MTIANDNYPMANGAGAYYRYLMGTIITSGAKDLAEDFQAFWFLDVIASYQGYEFMKEEEFQTWELTRIKNDEFLVIATDGNENILCTQEIPFSDFKADKATLWNVSGTIMLPKEY